MLFSGKKVAVLGMGESGIYASRLLHNLGAKVLLSDVKKKEDVKNPPPAFLEIEYGGHSFRVLEAEVIVVSPGIPMDVPIIKKAREKKIPIMGELELAFNYITSPIIAITGTAGKSTTTTLVGKMLEEDGRKVIVGGNIGNPLCSFFDEKGKWMDADVVVSEVSSFQLETIKKFRPKVATILNISINHLDRHSNFEEYIKAKERIMENQKKDDFSVLNMDCPHAFSLKSRTEARIIYFSRIQNPAKSSPPFLLSQESRGGEVGSVGEEGVFVRNGRIVTRFEGKENFVCDIAKIKLPGNHNLENILAAIASTLIFNVRKESITKVLKEFSGLEHRFEFADEIGGIKFINDSKATTIDSVLKALESINLPVILIAGGRYKGGDFGELVDFIKKNLKYIVLIGEAKDKIKKQLIGRDSLIEEKIREANSMGEAVRMAKDFASAGEYVLLSPGCSSFDMFQDYKERGKIFKEEVKKLNE